MNQFRRWSYHWRVDQFVCWICSTPGTLYVFSALGEATWGKRVAGYSTLRLCVMSESIFSEWLVFKARVQLQNG